MNLDDTRQFLEVLGQGAVGFVFQTFSDRDDLFVERNGRVHDPNAAAHHGRLDDVVDRLVRLNERGAAVSVTVNETDGSGKRRAENIVRARALFIDFDGPITNDPATTCPPTITVQSKRGPHYYWVLAGGGMDLARWEEAQFALATQYGGDPQCDRRQFAMRCPGFFHNKKEPHLVTLTDCDPDQLYFLDDLVAAFELDIAARARHQKAQQQRHRSNGSPGFSLPSAIPQGLGHDTLRRYAVSLYARGTEAGQILPLLREAASSRVLHRKVSDGELQGLVDWAVRTVDPSDRHDFHGGPSNHPLARPKSADWYERYIDKIRAMSRSVRDDNAAGRYLSKLQLPPPYGDDLLYHSSLLHQPTTTAHPALVAVMRNHENRIIAVECRYLTDDGDIAYLEPNRIVFGKPHGAFVHFLPLPSKAGTTLRTVVTVCETVEDALASRLLVPGFGALAVVEPANMPTVEPPLDYSACEVWPNPGPDRLTFARELKRKLTTDQDPGREKFERQRRLLLNSNKPYEPKPTRPRIGRGPWVCVLLRNDVSPLDSWRRR